MLLLHLGYYNNLVDLKMMHESNPDEVIFNYKVGKGHFYKIETEIYNYDEISHLNPEFTYDKDYAIVYDIPTDIEFLNKMSNTDYCDFFIDIYKVIEDNEMVHIDKVCELLKAKDKQCCGELSMIFGNNFIENFKKELIDYGK